MKEYTLWKEGKNYSTQKSILYDARKIWTYSVGEVFQWLKEYLGY